MSSTILYEAEESVRALCIAFMLGFGVLWFAVWGYGLIVTGDSFTADAIIGTLVFVLLEAVFIAGIVHGGVRYLQVNDREVLWRGPLEGDRRVRHTDVDWFEIPVAYGEGTPSTRIRLKSGETIYLPDIGDQALVHQLLLARWPLKEPSKKQKPKSQKKL